MPTSILARLLRGKSHLTALFCSALEPFLAVDFERFAFCDGPLATLIGDTMSQMCLRTLRAFKARNFLKHNSGSPLAFHGFETERRYISDEPSFRSRLSVSDRWVREGRRPTHHQVSRVRTGLRGSISSNRPRNIADDHQ